MPADPPDRVDSPRRTSPRRVLAAAATVRGRTTFIAVVVVGLASVVAAMALVVALRDLLADGVEKSTRQHATEVVEEILSLSPLNRLPRLDVADPDDEFVQVLDRHGVVVGSSANVVGLPAQITPVDNIPVEITGPLPERPMLVVSDQVPTVDLPLLRGGLTVLVGQSLDSVEDATQTVAELLAVGLPLMLGMIGVTVWLLTGRALAPVEAIRTEVDAISSSVLERRVPEPAGEDEIARLARTMNGMLGRLQRSVQRQRRFVADASHELRSPIAAIRQHAEVSLAHPARYPHALLAEVVLAEALRVQRLIDDLLLLARADEGSLPTRFEQVDLDDLVFAEAARLRQDPDPARPRTGSRRELRVDTSGVSAGRVSGGEDSLRRMVRNLVDNAVRHAAGQVSLGLAERGDEVLLSVEDDGPGIPEADRERVLKRFVRLDEARDRDNGGTGLGLAIVAELARAHGARLHIGEGSLGGARVELGFPRAVDGGPG